MIQAYNKSSNSIYHNSIMLLFSLATTNISLRKNRVNFMSDSWCWRMNFNGKRNLILCLILSFLKFPIISIVALQLIVNLLVICERSNEEILGIQPRSCYYLSLLILLYASRKSGKILRVRVKVWEMGVCSCNVWGPLGLFIGWHSKTLIFIFCIWNPYIVGTSKWDINCGVA